jgi:hypothetical protein
VSEERPRARACEELRQVLDDRVVSYFGVRGIDAEALAWYPNLQVVALTAPVGTDRELVCKETLEQRRFDLNVYSWDDDSSEAAQALRRAVQESCACPSVLVAYRPSGFLSDVWLSSEQVFYSGLFHPHQQCFECKPWVDRELRLRGVATLGWKQVSVLQGVPDLCDVVLPAVFRVSRSSGGSGCRLIRNPTELRSLKPPEGFGDQGWSFSPYLEDAVPLNLNATLWPDGDIYFHPSSVQLVGIKLAARHELAYCGNDFGAIKALPRATLDRVEDLVRQVGRWLHGRGYVGAFGLDVLVWEGEVFFVEVNPRFQASSRMSAHVDAKCERPDQYMTHLASFTSVRWHGPSLAEVVSATPPTSQVALYNLSDQPVNIAKPNAQFLGLLRAVPAEVVRVEPEALLCLVEFQRSVTVDGRKLHADVEATLTGIRSSLVRSEGPLPSTGCSGEESEDSD